jgi:ATP-binding cassette, subfamily B, bacterial
MEEDTLPISDISFLKSILSRIQGSKLISTIVFIAAGQVLYLILPWLMGTLVDKVITTNQWSANWVLLFPSIWLFSVMFSSLGKYFSSLIMQDVRKISKEMIFSHIIKSPSALYVSRDTGEVENLMQELSFSSRYIFNANFPFFIRVTLAIVTSLIMVFLDSIELSIIFFCWIVLYIPTSYFLASKSVKDVGESIISAANVSASTVEIIQNHSLIPSFGTENYEMSRFNELLNRERDSFVKTQTKIDKSDFYMRISQVFLPLSLALVLSFSTHYSNMTPGFFTNLFTMAIILTSQIGDFGKETLSFLEMRERIKTALSKLACPSSFTKRKHHEAIKPSSWDICFRDVDFSYDGIHPVIRNMNLEIRENEKIGIVGFSGAGKSTFLKLLRHFLEPTAGQITIGNKPLISIDSRDLAKGIAEVSQDIQLFHRSIRENIVYGCDYVEDNVVWAILEKAQIADRIMKLPEGLNTMVGVRGQKFSGGERARIAIARAFIRNARVILLDEATASVDSESEFLIQKGLQELMTGRTVVAISHRFSTLRIMDRIIVLEKGQVIADGSHQELICNSEIYQGLWNKQLSGSAMLGFE